MEGNNPVINTIKEMLEQRGYKDLVVENEDKHKVVKGVRGTKIIYAFITKIDKFNTEKTQEYIKLMQENDITHAIIVYRQVITSTAKKNIEKLPTNDEVNIKIELFSDKELRFNITKHRLQPKFKLFNHKEATTFKRDYGKSIPIMFTCDPIARFFNYKPGDIIRLTNSDGYVSYRIVKLKL